MLYFQWDTITLYKIVFPNRLIEREVLYSSIHIFPKTFSPIIRNYSK